MMKYLNRKNLIAALIIILIPAPTSADILVRLSETTLPVIHYLILAEIIAFYVFGKLLFRSKIKPWEVLLPVVIANITTSFIGNYVYLYRYTLSNLVWIGSAYGGSVIAEWIIYIIFLQRTDLTKDNLFHLSVICNLVTYLPIAILVAPDPWRYSYGGILG